MRIEKISAVTLKVANMRNAVRLYEDVLGSVLFWSRPHSRQYFKKHLMVPHSLCPCCEKCPCPLALTATFVSTTCSTVGPRRQDSPR